MKKIALLLIVPILLGSCLKNDEDKFSTSSADRMEARIAEARKILSDASNGWVMEYYPEKNRIYGGYTIFLKFTADEVTVSSEVHDPKLVSTSLYSIKADNGPVLRFDTYNDVFHFFSDPSTGANLGIGTKNGGLEGDMEFTIMEARPDYVKLKGKKTGNYVSLYPLAADANWEVELAKYQAAPSDMDFPTYRYVDAETGVDIPLSITKKVNNFSSRVFKITYPKDPTNENSETITVDIPFHYTQTGFKFYKPLVIYNKEVSEMVFTDDYYFTDKDGSSVTIMTPEPIRSNMTVAISIPTATVTYNTALTTFTPSVKTEYYYYMVYTKEANANVKDKDIIKGVIAEMNGLVGLQPTYTPEFIMQNLCGKGDGSETWSDLETKTTYVVAAFGCSASKDGKNIVATTNLFKQEFTTTDLPASTSADYRAWLGNWKVVSTSSKTSGSPITLNVSIKPKVADASFNVRGWTISVLNDIAVIGTYVTGNKSIQIKDNQKIESESDSGGDCVYVPYAKTPTGGWTLLTGGWNTAITMTLNSDKTSGNATCPIVTNGGNQYPIVTFDFWYLTKDGKIYGYNPGTGYTSGDYPIGPYTLTKVNPSAAAMLEDATEFKYIPSEKVTKFSSSNNKELTLVDIPQLYYN